jgi:catechol 2,3-dioxygenase
MEADAAGAPRDPEELEATAMTPGAAISPLTAMGTVHLTVSDLARSLGYYRAALGLDVLGTDAASATLGAGTRPLLTLVEEPGARPSPGRTGLYHVALLVPTRRDLAGWLAHAVRERVRLVGLSDHAVSEAVYLSDPDGHGLEIYADRPREAWDGLVGERLTTLPLDVESLLAELDDPASKPFAGLPAGTVVGHVHLRVASIRDAIGFYRDVLGFGLMARLGSQAAFLSAGGYHHHVGANTWESAGAGPPEPGSAALRQFTVVLPDDTARGEVVARLDTAGSVVGDTGGSPSVLDPSGNLVVLALPD